MTDDTDYQFKVRAVNATGTGAESDASTAVAPKDETLTASEVEATTATLTIGSYSGNWYYKYTSPSSGTCSSTAVTGTTKDLTNLSSNTSYTFKAYSDTGCSTELATASAFLTKPGKPTGLTVTSGAGSGKLTLAASVTGEGTLSKWQYQQKASTDNDFGSWKDISSTETSLSYTVTGLTDTTSYQFKVRAVNDTGDGVVSDASTAVAPKDETLAASEVEATTATLTISNYIGDWYYKYTSPSGGDCSSDAVSTSEEDINGLSSNTSYTFKAYSDSSCSTELATAPAFLTKPGKPGTPTATAGTGSGKLTLAASVTGDGTLSKWQYQQKKEGNNNFGSWKNISSTSTSLSHVVTGLTDGTDYQFKVRAVNDTGDGAASDASTAVAPLDETLAASNVEAATATLTISNYTGSWHYKHTVPGNGTCSSTAVSGKTADLTGLTGNTNYTFKAYGNSGCSTELAEAPAFLTKPGKPDKPTATADVGIGKLELASSVAGSGTLEKWQYQQKASTDTDFGSWQNISSTSTKLSHTVSGLTDGTDYQFKVRAVNATGTGAASDASTAAAPTTPALTVTNVKATTATLTISNYTRSWYYKHTTPANGTCSAVSKATADLTGLTPETDYTYVAYSDAACTQTLLAADDPPVTFTTEKAPVRTRVQVTVTPPLAPSKPSVAAGNAQVTLTWGSRGNGGSAITRWQYVKQVGETAFETAWTDVPDSDERTTTHTVTGLTNGTAYRFKVRAVNAVGNGVESPQSDAVTPVATAVTPPAPGKPAVAAGNQQVTLTWTPNGDGGSTITGWQYVKKVGENPFEDTWNDVPNSDESTTTHIVTGLTNGTAYRFKVRAVNAVGDGAESPQSDVVTPAAPPPAPGKPAVAAGDEQVTLAWTFNGDGGSTITRWQYVKKVGENPFEDTWNDVPNSDESTTTHIVTGLTNGTAYRFKVRAVNAVGDGAESPQSDVVTPVTPAVPPPAPGKPAVAVGDEQVTLTWTSNGNGGSPITGWQYVKQVGEAAFETTWTDVPGSGESTTTHTVTGLTNGAAYRFKVRAVNAVGHGAESPQSDAVTPVAPAEPEPEPERLTRVNETLAPELARAMTTSAVEAVKKRLGHVASGTAEAPAVHDSVVYALAANHEALQEDTITWREALRGVSFVHSLGADGASAGGVRRPTLWGGADYRSLSGGGEAGLPWDGGVDGVHLGLDARFGDVLLGGLALSMTEGSFDYTDRTGAAEVPERTRRR